MYNCYLCSIKNLLSVNELILHLQIFHNLNNYSLFICNQNSCVRNFRGIDKFRKHLNKEHTTSTLTLNLNLNEVTIPNVEINSTSSKSTLLNPESLISHTEIENKINNSFENIVTNSAVSFIADLYSNPSMTETLLQTIVTGTNELISNGIICHLKSKIEPLLDKCTSEQIQEIDKLFNVLVNPFAKLDTKFLRMKYLEENNLYVKPKSVVVGYTKEKKIETGIERLLMVPIEGHLISLKTNLKSFFELPGVLDIALNYLKNSMKSNLLSSYLNGSSWKYIYSKFPDKIVFPLFLYYDDAEMGNPLGSHSGVHKMGCVYYSVAALPPEYLSSLNNIFVAFLFHSADRGQSKINNKKMFAALIKELIDLQENGILLSTNVTIYFTLGLVLGDNLGLNSILGFVESFSANFYCRICYLPKSDLQNLLKESKLIRNKINYEDHINQANVSITGIKERCIFNEVPNYHVVENIVCDFMHDIPEGVARYDMAVIINSLIQEKYFTLDELNSRIQLFAYGVTEQKNSPPSISQRNLNNGSIIMSASEMLCFIRYFGLIIGELVPLKTGVWYLYISLRKIVDLCCARTIQPECSVQLDALVAEHNRLYLKYSNSKLKPKHHILTHYGRLLLKNGPIILTSSIRFEAKHKVLKSIANSIPCRINLGYTLAHKLQMQNVSRLLTQTGLVADLNVGKGQDISFYKELFKSFDGVIPQEIINFSYVVPWCEYKGIYYKPGMILTLGVNLDDCFFGEVKKIIIGQSKIPYFLVTTIQSVGFDRHFHAYEVLPYNNNNKIMGYYIYQLPDVTPSVTRVLGNGKLYVTLRYKL